MDFYGPYMAASPVFAPSVATVNEESRVYPTFSEPVKDNDVALYGQQLLGRELKVTVPATEHTASYEDTEFFGTGSNAIDFKHVVGLNDPEGTYLVSFAFEDLAGNPALYQQEGWTQQGEFTIDRTSRLRFVIQNKTALQNDRVYSLDGFKPDGRLSNLRGRSGDDGPTRLRRGRGGPRGLLRCRSGRPIGRLERRQRQQRVRQRVRHRVRRRQRCWNRLRRLQTLPHASTRFECVYVPQETDPNLLLLLVAVTDAAGNVGQDDAVLRCRHPSARGAVCSSGLRTGPEQHLARERRDRWNHGHRHVLHR